LFIFTRVALIAENLFLRKQLALFQKRQAKSRRTTASLRLAMVALAKFFEWRNALVIVKPETFVKWHRTAFRTFWRWKSRKRGRPALPKDLRELIHLMAYDNPTWGEERIVDELRRNWAFESLLERLASTWPVVSHGEAPASVGPTLCGIMHRLS
jgi:putative transposase